MTSSVISTAQFRVTDRSPKSHHLLKHAALLIIKCTEGSKETRTLFQRFIKLSYRKDYMSTGRRERVRTKREGGEGRCKKKGRGSGKGGERASRGGMRMLGSVHREKGDRHRERFRPRPSSSWASVSSSAAAIGRTNYMSCGAQCKTKIQSPLFNTIRISRWQRQSIKPNGGSCMTVQATCHEAALSAVEDELGQDLQRAFCKPQMSQEQKAP